MFSPRYDCSSISAAERSHEVSGKRKREREREREREGRKNIVKHRY